MKDNLSDVELYFALFDLPAENGQYHAVDWPLYRSDATIQAVKTKALTYGGLISVSHFIRAFTELRDTRAISPVRAVDPFKVSREETLTASDYHKMSAQQVVIAYRNPSFRAQVDALIARGEI